MGADEGPVTLVKSRQFDLLSRNGRVYRIFIAEPIRPAPPEGCPVVYVLDANAMFGTVVEASRFQKNLTPAVIVGIGYPTEALLDPDRRYLEYTPVTPPERLNQSPNEPQVKPGGTGGQAEFLAFIEGELKPAISERVRIDPNRQALLGHSLAGRFVLHTLFASPRPFQTYLALSPSIWWGEGSVLEEEKSFAASGSASGQVKTANGEGQMPRGLFVAVGEFEQQFSPSTPPERAAFLTRARMVDNAREMADRLAKLNRQNVKVEFKEFAGLNHGSVLPSAISQGLNIALRAPAIPAPSTAK
ncbi:MAG: alpha/beta hydrolase [Pyrinomonadaceae bacterium]|nr:alpha/beta hydrolase [Phycisphaerales bacterium]